MRYDIVDVLKKTDSSSVAVQRRKKRAEIVAKHTGFVARATAARTLLCKQIRLGWDMIWDRGRF
jgi:hypothetical protein